VSYLSQLPVLLWFSQGDYIVCLWLIIFGIKMHILSNRKCVTQEKEICIVNYTHSRLISFGQGPLPPFTSPLTPGTYGPKKHIFPRACMQNTLMTVKNQGPDTWKSLFRVLLNNFWETVLIQTRRYPKAPHPYLDSSAPNFTNCSQKKNHQ